jgi:hypothetical protein
MTAQAGSDGSDENNKGDGEAKEVQANQVPSLDEVNDLTQQKLDEEGDDGSSDQSGASDDGDGSGSADGGAGDDDKGGDSGADGAAGAGDDDDAGSGDGAGTGEEAIPTPTKDDPLPGHTRRTDTDQPAAQLDKDITKPGEGKVAVKSFDGKTYYFNDITEVPADFEPASYTETMRAGKDFAIKEQNDALAEQQAEQDSIREQLNTRAQGIQASWAADQKRLGLKDDDPEVDKTLQYIEDQMKPTKENPEGVIIESFAQAHKARLYDEHIAAEAAQQDATNQNKKTRGGKVQAGGTSNPNKNVTREAPPPGVGLDAVHAHALETLGN